MTSPDEPPASPIPSRSARHCHDAPRPAKRPRHLIRWSLLGVLAVLVVGAAWIVVTAILARGQLEQARSQLGEVRSALSRGQTDQSRAALDDFAHSAEQAHALTTGPAWFVAASIPWLGDPVESVRGISAQADAIGQLAPQLDALSTELSPSTLRPSGNRIDLAALQRAMPSLNAVARALPAANDRVQNLPAHTWLSPVDRARAQLADQLAAVTSTVQSADQTMQVLPTLLGSDGTKRYFVAFQNEAEMRGTGGLPGAFAIITATDGQIAVERLEPDGTLIDQHLQSFLPEAFNQAWADKPYYFYVDGNVSANFPYAAEIWSRMWQQFSGETLDGVLTVDPTALSYLLAATGPTKLADGTAITADNVVTLTQQTVYAKYPDFSDTEDRKNYLLAIADAVSLQVLNGSGNVSALLSAGARAATEGRILMSSTNATAESVLAAHRIGGVIPDSADPYGQLVINNNSGGKREFYLDRKLSVVRSGCGDQRQVDVAITLTNNAPASGLPPYVDDRVDEPRPPDVVPGQDRLLVDYVATRGAGFTGVTLDGQNAGAPSLMEVGDHPMFRIDLEIKPGQTRTIVMHLIEPDNGAPFQMVSQPGVRPIQIDVDDRSCRP